MKPVAGQVGHGTYRSTVPRDWERHFPQAPKTARIGAVINVWIADWEMECCGEPFAIGDFVQWPAVRVDRSDWLERLFHGTRTVVHYSYRAHGDDGDDTVVIGQVAGRVERIDAVTSGVVRTPIDATAVSIGIAEGEATRRPIKQVHRQPPIPNSNTSEFFGYLVALDEG